MSTAGLQLPGYAMGPIIGRSGGRAVYQATRLEDGLTVAVKTLEADYPSRQQVAGLRREAEIVQRLSRVDGVCKVYATLPYGSGNLALIVERYEHSLASRLGQTRRQGLPLVEVLDIALHLAQTLGEIHSQNIVYKALSAEHVLFDPIRGAMALTGFGIASELDQERQSAQMPRPLGGPLPYMSPEQTGRMNRDLDYRSDYYSLGVLLYEMLTGQLPFQADNLLEWVHSHISRSPQPPHEISPDIPQAVSAIVLKLMAKNPEARYQSAEGLIHDLTRCADGLASGGVLADFALGQKDVIQKFLIPQNLYGRERELSLLLNLFESAVAGNSEFCLIHGYSGVGKTSLVKEIDRPLVRERGFWVQGKFDQFQPGDAYSAIAATFRGLVQQILAEPEERLAFWRQRLLEALAPNAALVVALVPELELVIGPQPAVAELPPAEENNRLHLVLTSFLRVFAGEGHPVVLFLDDLQWANTTTLALLRRLVTTHELSHLLLVGAYRSNEVGPGHPLRLLMEDLQPQIRIRELALRPLDRAAVAHLVADGLSCAPEDSRPLSDLIFDKTQGNPFFANELLRQLHKEGAIYLDTNSGVWKWDLDAVRWSGVNNDVVQFMIDNLRGLQPEIQQVLHMAACIGGTFDLQTLSTICERTPAETAAVLLPALKQHMVLPLHTNYQLVGDDTDLQEFNPTYRFQHDRVQQAAYAMIDPQQLPEVHLTVGRLLLKNAGKEVADDRLIDIVGHFNKGRHLILSGEERLGLARLNLRAGIRAKRSSAYEAALNYLQIVAELLPGDLWRESRDFMKTLAVETQQCAYLTGRIEEAETWAKTLLNHARSNLERSEIHATQTRQYATLGRMDDSIASAIEGLSLLGVDFSSHPTQMDISYERQQVIENLGERKISELVHASPVESPSILMSMRLLMEIFAAAFLSGSGNLFPYLILKAVNLSLRHGNCPESAFVYAAYGMLLCGELDEPEIGYQYGKVGLAINEQYDDLTLKARVIYVYAMFVHHWSEHWSSLTPLFRKGIEAGRQSGDLLYLAYSAQDCVIWDPTLDLDTASRQHAEHLEIVRECAYQDSLDSGTLFLQMQRNLLGLTHNPFTLTDDGFDEERCLAGMRQRRFMTGIANYHIYSAEVCWLHGNNDRALMHVREQDKLVTSVMSLPQLTRFYIVAFLTLVTHYPTMEPQEQAETRRRLERDLARMAGWADNCEENFRHLHYLMEAELACLDGRMDVALHRFDAAIDSAQQSGFLRDEAVALERAARYQLSLGRKRAAEGYLRGAHRVFDRWGANCKVTLLEQEFPVLREMAANPGGAHGPSHIKDLDLASIMKASRTISGEIVLDRLLKTTLSIILENAGGQWGCLVVRRQGRLEVEAAKLPEAGLPPTDLSANTLVSGRDGAQIPLPVTLINEALFSGQAIMLENAGRESGFIGDPYIRRFQPASVLCVPICREHFAGALYIENNLASGVFTRENVEVITLLAAQAAVAVENAHLYEQVQHYSKTLEEKVSERTVRLQELNQELQRLADCDGLTGVANRRRGDAYLEEVWRRHRRNPQPLSVIMLDIDYFKAFNDTYGHQAGDNCLITVAETIREQLKRQDDLVARYGGEEFILVLPETDRNGVALVAEKLRTAIEALAITHGHSPAGVITASLGAATILPTANDTAQHLVREADAALYRAKKMGRNRVQLTP